MLLSASSISSLASWIYAVAKPGNEFVFDAFGYFYLRYSYYIKLKESILSAFLDINRLLVWVTCSYPISLIELSVHTNAVWWRGVVYGMAVGPRRSDTAPASSSSSSTRPPSVQSTFQSEGRSGWAASSSS